MKTTHQLTALKNPFRVLIFFILFYTWTEPEFSAQTDTTGCIRATLFDAATKEAIPFANIILYNLDGKQIGVSTTNMDGEVFFKPIAPGKYILKGVYVGYQVKEIKNIIVNKSKTTFVPIALRHGEGVKLNEVEVIGYTIPLTDPDAKSGATINREDYMSLAVKDIASTTAAVYESSPEAPVERGARAEGVYELADKNKDRTRLGLLTATEINDFQKWDLWSEYSKPALANYSKVWGMFPGERYVLQLKNKQKRPLNDALVKMYSKNDQLIWQSKTDNTGKAELWYNFTDTETAKPKYMTVTYAGRVQRVNHLSNFKKGINQLTLDAFCANPKKLEVLFVVDATASMEDEIDHLKRGLQSIIDAMDRGTGAEILTGAVFYRDESEEYVTRKSDLNADAAVTLNFIAAQKAFGGGDNPEAVDQALDAAVNEISWSESEAVRIIFLLLDAPPHANKGNIELVTNAMKQAAAKGIRIVPVLSSGSDQSTEYLNRCIALATNGTCVFLTNHSGIGNSHAAPTTPSYEVEYLNSLVLRLIRQFSVFTCFDKEEFMGTQNDTGRVIIAREILDSAIVNSKHNDLTLVTLADTLSTAENKSVLTEIKFFPNPCSEELTIDCPEDIKEILLCDVQARVLQRIELRGRKTKIRLNDYPAGIYFLKCEIKGKFFSGKLVIR